MLAVALSPVYNAGKEGTFAMKFSYAANLLADHPHIVGGIIAGTGLRNGPSPADLQELFRHEQRVVKERLPDPVSELPTLAAWRQAFRRFGANPTKYRSAAEALVRRLSKKGDIPTINVLVDVGNLVSIRYALPVAIFDTRAIRSAVTVRPAQGSEHFVELGSSERVHPLPGEVIFCDENDMVIARRWCWRQSAESAADLTTTDVLIAVEAQDRDGHLLVPQAVADLTALLAHYAGGTYSEAILDAEQPLFPG